MNNIANLRAPANGADATADPPAQASEAVAFLEVLTGGRGRVAVAAITPDGPLRGDTFEMPAHGAVLENWIASQNGTANLYYSVNAPKPRDQQTGKTGRITEADVHEIRGVVIDIDPDKTIESTEGGFERERARLMALADEWRNHFMLAPTAIVDSGGGIQLIWLFPEPLHATPENRATVKAQAAAMARALGGDATQSLDHLFRLPGTANIPNAKKAEKGRRRCEARLIHLDPKSRYALADLCAMAAPNQRPAESSTRVDMTGFDYDAVRAAADDLATLPQQLKDWLADQRRASTGIDRILANINRSDRDYGLACYAIERGVIDPTAIGQIVFSLSPEKLLEKDGAGSGLSDLEYASGGYGAGYAISTIRRALARTKPPPPPEKFIQPIADAEGAEAVALPERQRFKQAKTVEFPINAAEIPRREWLVWPAIPRREAVLLVGPPKAAKSAWALTLTLAIASGDPALMFGRERRAPWRFKPARVLIVNNEDPTNEIMRRLAAASAAGGVAPSSGSISILSGADADSAPYKVLTKTTGGIENAPGFDHIAAEIVRHRADLVIFDSLVSMAAGLNENDNGEMDHLIRTLRALAARAGASALIVHHTGKKSADAGDANSARGASSIYGAIRSGVTLLLVEDEDRKKAGLPEGSYVRLDDSGGNYAARDGLTHVWRKESGSVGNGAGESTGGDLSDVDSFHAAAGDTAPVFQYVGGFKTFGKGKAASAGDQGEGHAASVAEAVNLALGSDESRALDKGFKAVLGEELRKLGVIGGTSAASIDRALNGALSALGVEIMTGGQKVRIYMTREGEGRTARRVINRRIGSDIHNQP